MNSVEKTLVVLSRHLEQERQCLEEMLLLLHDESDALRRMALSELEDFAHRKEALINDQYTLARERQSILTRFHSKDSDVSLGQIIELASPESAAPLRELQIVLLELAEQIKGQNTRNQTFAKTGHGLVSRLFRIIGIGRADRKSTYSANGRISEHLLAHSNSRSLP